VASDRAIWHTSCQRTNYAQGGPGAVGAALLLGQWWRAAELLHEARGMYPHRAAWTAWLSEIPVSESHAANLVRCYRAGVATPALTVRAAIALLADDRGRKKHSA